MKISYLDRYVKTGEFQFIPNQSLFSVIKQITSVTNFHRSFLVIEGSTVNAVRSNLLENPYLVGLYPANIKEGSLLPDTYYFDRGDTRESMIVRMQIAMSEFLNKEWLVRDNRVPYKTPEQALILASMLEKEASDFHEKKIIAGVFINRLKIGMKLQSDPTAAYGLHIKDVTKLHKKDLYIKTPYNTYTKYGLPIGPIDNPGRDSIVAALHPIYSDYLYFVADGNGKHIFANTLREQNNNVIKWKKIRNKQKNLKF